MLRVMAVCLCFLANRLVGVIYNSTNLIKILYKLYFLYLPSASADKDYRAAYREWALSPARMKDPYITRT